MEAQCGSGKPGKRTRWPRFWRCGALVVALIAGGIAATACGGSPSASVANLGSTTTTTTPSSGASSSSASEAQLLKYTSCMRSHGIDDFPDPILTPGGWGFQINAAANSDLDPRSPQFQAAETACRKYYSPPNKSGNETPAEEAAADADALKVAECMRSHGEPDFPDPNGQGVFVIADPSGILEPSSPQFQRAQNTCLRRDPYGMRAQFGSGSGGKGAPK